MTHTSQILRAWRARDGLTQVQAAAALGVGKRTYEQWEQGRREPDHPSLLRLAVEALQSGQRDS